MRNDARSMSGAGLAALALAAVLLGAGPATAQATTLGPAAARCNANTTAVLVEVDGFKARSGTLRVQLYDSNPRTYLEKGKWVERVDLPVARGGGAMRVCVPVDRPGSYVVSVRHDLNGNGKSDKSDGGGFSGNPSMTLGDVLFKRKPSLARTSVAVDDTTRRVSVTLKYLQGSSFAPVR